MARSGVSRRAFLKAMGSASLCTVLGGLIAGCQQAPKVVEGEKTAVPTAATAATSAPAAAPLKGKLVTLWGEWTPTESMERSEDNPNPHNKLLEVLDKYKSLHPDVQIEWIRFPAGMQFREWCVAQQVAGTIPHIVSVSYWEVKEDLDKGWWVELTPFLNEPNPYVAAGEPGSAKWLDQFYPAPTGPTMFRNGYWNLCLGLVTTFFYYNVDWFDKLGLKAPKTYAEFLDVCKAFKKEGVNAYGGWVGSVYDTDHWYRVQLGGMVMARDVEPLVNPQRGACTQEMLACAIKKGDYHPRLPQYKEWLELWKQNVPYRSPDWGNPEHNPSANFLKKVEPIMENANWVLPQLKNDPLMDFRWDAFYAPLLTKESSQFVSDPPTPAWPIGGPSSDQFAVATRCQKDGVLPLAIDLLRFITEPKNLYTIQGEMGVALPNIKGVPVPPELKPVHEQLANMVGETAMFVYEADLMDEEVSLATGQAWRAYLMDQMSVDDAIKTIDEAFKAYADRFTEKEKLDCK